jgi:hypothetical protein
VLEVMPAEDEDPVEAVGADCAGLEVQAMYSIRRVASEMKNST